MFKYRLFPLIALLWALNALAGQAVSRLSDRPNILLIVVDDLGYGELGCQGNPQVLTPHIDSLAQNGVRFTNGYVSAPYCSPSRAGLLTGRNQARFGYDRNPVGDRNLNPELGLPLTEVTLAEELKEAGYGTGLVGKWHLGADEQHHPLERGFDEFYGFLHEGHFYAPITEPDVVSFLRTNTVPDSAGGRWTQNNVVWSTHMGHNEPLYDKNNPILRGRSPVTEDAFLTDAWAREATRFVRRHREEPWFLFLSYNAPHSPMQAHEDVLQRFDHIDDLHRRVFVAMVAHLDNTVGRVLSALRELNLEEETLIFFLSDHGGPTRELTSRNAPLSGGKSTLYEGGLRVPFIIQWKGRLPAGNVDDRPISALDIFPTALAAANATAPTARLDGVNLLPYLTGEKTGLPHETLHWRYGERHAVRQGDWKAVKPKRKEQWELYHLGEDIGEQNNLAGVRPDRLAHLKSVWKEWNADMAAPKR